MSSTPTYSVIIDPMFNLLAQNVVITNPRGTYVDGLGNQLQFLNVATEFKSITKNSAELYISGIMKFDQQTSLQRVTFIADIIYYGACYWYCATGITITTTLFDAYIDGVTLNPGYYLFTVRIVVSSGQFTKQ